MEAQSLHTFCCTGHVPTKKHALQRWMLGCIFLISQTNKLAQARHAAQSQTAAQPVGAASAELRGQSKDAGTTNGAAAAIDPISGGLGADEGAQLLPGVTMRLLRRSDASQDALDLYLMKVQE